ncbi:LysR family transcriptional regulator [Photobacterium lutimaris]|uniref:LysR family transcriptional regulator n=1 Tax=Photobacterium lutimaris TaxID=388278 RepID=A0A2T3IVC1_9GAMM|nr:LysR family transcriptional regulator [Photobacterium lutimaris]PSU32372.1 LysR family transcriptional regulator [Photobacterium lutimaris]TDR77567.1 DNA-binding transcriptional LysR family regulator [Photobacterium lutimaris]
MSIRTILTNSNLPTVKQLQCFLAVAQELNFRKAAERINITQPPLTRQIRCLEDLLGYELFTRNTHVVHLTKPGNDLLIEAEKILCLLNGLKSINNKGMDRIRVGTTNTLNFSNIPSIDGALNSIAGLDSTDGHSMNSGQLIQNLRKSSLDIALIGEKNLRVEEDISFHWIYREALVLAMPASHKAAIQSQVSLEDVSDLPLFWFPSSANPAFYDKCERLFKRLSFPLKRIKEPGDSIVMLSRIAEGDAMALMPRSMCTFSNERLCYKELTDDHSKYLNIDVYAAIKNNDRRSSVIDVVESLKHFHHAE